ncbi:odorant receptor 85b-like [Diachasmimorpha longicaudata]
MKETADFFDHPYYKFTKTMTSLVGQWPHQTTKELIIHRSCLFVIISLQLMPQFFAVYVYRNDFKILLDTLSPFIVDATLLVKVVNSYFHSENLIHLLNLIKENWTIFPQSSEQRVLHYHSDLCSKASLLYLGAMYFGTFQFATEPLQRKLLYALIDNNVTVEKVFAIPMEFPSTIDMGYWYYPILLISTFFIMVFLTVVGSCDLLLFLYSEHAVGLFKALGYAIEHLPPNDSEGNNYSFEYLKSCAAVHSRAIYFAEQVRDIYLWAFFGVIGLNTIILSITGVQVVINKEATEKVIKYFIFVIMQSMHLFAECYAAQRLMDASYEIKERLTSSVWYIHSLKTQRLLPLMIMRSQSPIVLTAGKMIVMNMDTYAVVLKTAASYFTIFLAMQ